MKLKTKMCSTGHGTGVLQEVSLHERLLRDRVRKLVKKYARRYNRVTEVRAERSPEDKRAFVLGLLQGDPAMAKRAGYVLTRASA